MNNIIQLANRQIGDVMVQTVNARDLHAFLEVGKDFSTWIKDRVAQYGFVEHQDYALYLLPNFGEKGQGRSSKEYAISLDMAKELAMVERNDKGKQARQYFIACERKAKELSEKLIGKQVIVDPAELLSDPAAMRGLLLGYTEKVIQLEGQVNYLTPKADALDRIANADGSLCIRDAAKTLQVQEKKLIKALIEQKWIYQRPMGTGKLAYADKLQSGLMEHKITSGNKPDGSEWVSTQVRITAKGITKLSQMLQSTEAAA